MTAFGMDAEVRQRERSQSPVVTYAPATQPTRAPTPTPTFDATKPFTFENHRTPSQTLPSTPSVGTYTTTPTYPFVAENGSYYGEPNANGVPKTVHVNGYFRKDGTYVRGHYRSSPRR
jgi:hypothetical protein